jgi:anti-anti-sigma factor
MAEIYIIEQGTDLTAVGLRGELDSQGVQEVETKFNATICPPGHNAIVDFSEVTFLASLGLRMLVAAAKVLAARGARMVISSPQEMVRESLVGASLDEIIPLVDNQEDARRILDA